jgi:hypothetical protein
MTYLVAYLATYLFTYLLTYLLTACSRVLLKKITGFQIVKKFPTFYGTQRFITAFTSARKLPPSRAVVSTATLITFILLTATFTPTTIRMEYIVEFP